MADGQSTKRIGARSDDSRPLTAGVLAQQFSSIYSFSSSLLLKNISTWFYLVDRGMYVVVYRYKIQCLIVLAYFNSCE